VNQYLARVLLYSLLLAHPLSLLAQNPTEQKSTDDKLVIGANEVLLDIVVRDKKGRTVRDLQASDFQILEEGMAQDVKSFRLVIGGDADATKVNGNADATKMSSQARTSRRVMEDFRAGRLGTVALVFDRLSLDSRKRAHEAALSYVGDGLAVVDFIGVFGIDLSLAVFQTFTNNAELVKQGLDRAVVTSSSSSSANLTQINSLAQRNLALTNQINQIQGGPVEGAEAIGGALATEQAFNSLTLDAAQKFELLEQTQQSQATTAGLLSIVSAMGKLPGRKAVILFSEGVAIPTTVQAGFQSIISNANRANVSIYAVDAAGLRVKSTQAEAGTALSTLGQKRAAQAASGNDSFSSMMRDSERNEELVRRVPESGLGQLADQTGGFLISDTNNPGARLRQANEDLHTYYALTYTSKNQNFDGRFRRINIKLARSGLDVQVRKGYYALPAVYNSPVLPFETAALAILAGKTQPTGFPTKIAAFSFPETGHAGLVPVIVEVPSGTANFVVDVAKKTYRTDLSIVVLIRDDSQQVVRKLSTQYLLSGPLDQVEQAKRGNILFYRETDLDPGQYTVESIVYDATNSGSGINRTNLLVGENDETKLRLSTLIVVGRAQKLSAEDRQNPNPFHAGELLLYPNLGEPLHKTAGKALSVFVTIYRPKGTSTAPSMVLEVDQAGRPLGKLPVDLPAADQSGRIQYTGTIPLEAFPLGDYELKATVSDGTSNVTRVARFTVNN